MAHSDTGDGSGGQISGSKSLLTQSFLTSLPIVLTVGLGFLANYWQSRQQHETEMATLAAQAEMDRNKQAFTAAEAERGRRTEAEAKLRQQQEEALANSKLEATRFAQEQASLQSQHTAQQLQQAREFEQSLERQRRQTESDLLLEVIKVGDLEVARSNIEFLLQAGLVRDENGRIAQATRQAPPVLPTASGSLSARGFEDTGALPTVAPSSGGQQLNAASKFLNCAITEYNKNVRENGGDQQIKIYLQALGLSPDARIAWSGAFIGYCIKVTGQETQITPSAANRTMMESAMKSGIWLAGTEVTPQPGDIYFIARENNAFGMQTGVVREVNGREFEGLEGNLQDRISLVPRSLDTPRLQGFARLRGM